MGSVIELILVTFLLQQPLEQSDGAAAEERVYPLDALGGTVSARYRYRRTSDVDDSDLYAYAQLHHGDPGEDPVTFSMSGRASYDMDHDRGGDGFHPFDSLDDTHDGGVTARLYTAYADFHKLREGLELRVGRQQLDEMPEALPLDGGRIQMSHAETALLGLYAGLPVNLFESSTEEDATYGGWIEWLPRENPRLRVDYLHLRDETAFGLFEDDLFALSAEERFGSIRSTARYTVLEGESRDAALRAGAANAKSTLLLDLDLRYSFKRQQAHAYALDPYSLFLIELEPYVQTTLRGSQGFTDPLFVDASITNREMVEDDDETTYNHEFTRWSLTPRTQDWPAKNVSIATSIDFWQSSASDFWTVSGDASWKRSDSMTLSAGSSYSLYDIDTMTGQEREDVRTVYGRMKLKLDDSLTLDLRASWEENDIDEYTTVEMGVRHAF